MDEINNNYDGKDCENNFMIVAMTTLFSVALIFINFSCIPAAIAGHIKPDETDLIYYPFYGTSTLALMFSMGFTFVAMIVINVSYYC